MANLPKPCHTHTRFFKIGEQMLTSPGGGMTSWKPPAEGTFFITSSFSIHFVNSFWLDTFISAGTFHTLFFFTTSERFSTRVRLIYLRAIWAGLATFIILELCVLVCKQSLCPLSDKCVLAGMYSLYFFHPHRLFSGIHHHQYWYFSLSCSPWGTCETSFYDDKLQKFPFCCWWVCFSLRNLWNLILSLHTPKFSYIVNKCLFQMSFISHCSSLSQLWISSSSNFTVNHVAWSPSLSYQVQAAWCMLSMKTHCSTSSWPSILWATCRFCLRHIPLPYAAAKQHPQTLDKLDILWVHPNKKMGNHKLLEASCWLLFLFETSLFNCGVTQVKPNVSKDKRWRAVKWLKLINLFLHGQLGLLLLVNSNPPHHINGWQDQEGHVRCCHYQSPRDRTGGAPKDLQVHFWLKLGIAKIMNC